MVQTLRVACGGAYTGRYTLQDQFKVPIDLTAATPAGVELRVYHADSGLLVAATPCVIITPTQGLIEYSIKDCLAATPYMGTMQFIVTKPDKVEVAPGGVEQGLWVYQ